MRPEPPIAGCKLTIAGQPDASSIPTLVRDVVALLPPGASVEDKVLALYRYTREHLFAGPGTMDDLIESLNKAAWTLNWWGFGLCGRQAKVFGMLCAELLGREHVRLVGIREREPGAWRGGEAGRPYAFCWTPLTRGWQQGQIGGHTTIEIRYDASWHFFDVMVGFYRRDEAGRVVALQEILDRPELADRPVGDPLHGDMPYGPEAELFTACEIKSQSVNYTAWPGELPPLNLRPGERLSFLPAPLPGQFHMHPRMWELWSEHLPDGPYERRPNAPPAAYGNAEHVFKRLLRPDASDPLWCPHSGDWRVEVELPYPITSIHWQMAVPGATSSDPARQPTGLLHFGPSHGEDLEPIAASGSHQPGRDTLMGRRYHLFVRAPERQGPVELTLRTIVQHNPLVRPRLKAGTNRVHLLGQGPGRLIATLGATVAGEPFEARLVGAGEHVVDVPGEPAGPQTLTLANEGE